MDAFPTSPEDRASLVARHEPLQAACDDLYLRLVEALPRKLRLMAASQLRLLSGTEIVADEYDEEILDDYALHLELDEDETFLTRKLAEGFVKEGSEDERLLSAFAEARFSLYEIVQVIPGLGIELHDLLRDCRTCVVMTDPFPPSLGPGHHFMCRVMTVDGITMMACAGLPIPEGLARDLADSIRNERALDPIAPNAREPRWLSQALIEVMMKVKKGAFGKEEPAQRGKIGWNDPCRCGSGRKYRECCGALN